MRVGGLTFRARFRFTHKAGQDYRHYIEATIFGITILKVNAPTWTEIADWSYLSV